MKNIAELDPAMAIKPADADGVAWHLPFETPMKLCGFNWFETDKLYERLPMDRPETVTRFPNGEPQVIPSKDCGAIQLSSNTAGGQVRFRTDSSRFLIQATLAATGGMDHMAFTGSAGFDIYIKSGDIWKCLGVTRTDHSKRDFTTTVRAGLKRDMRDVIINFPLYNGVKSLAIGLDDDAKLEAPTPFTDDRPAVMYGTSITQGGCATRPGMCSTNILSRMLNREVINLGFSGNGRGEPEIAAMLADIKNPSLYMLDYCWNTQIKEFAVTLPNVIDIIRAKHPTTPILLVAPTPGVEIYEEFQNPSPRLSTQTLIMLEETQKRNKNGDANVFFFNGFTESVGEDFWEGMVDGCHMTDLGFLRFSEAILPHIQKRLG